MGRKRIGPRAEEIPKRKLNLRTGRIELNPLEVGMKAQVADKKKRKVSALGGRDSLSDLIRKSKSESESESESDGDDDEQLQSHNSDVMEQSHDSLVSSSAPSSGDELSSSVIARCKNLGDVEIVKESDGMVYLKDHAGEEVRLDPAVLFANLSEADRSRLLKVFAQRPDTFMHMGSSLGSFFVRFALGSFSQMLGTLENMKIGDLSEADLDDLLKSFGDMQRCLIKTDWLEAELKRIKRLKKAKLERIERLKAIDTEWERARTDIEELKVLLSKAEEKKYKLDEEAHALGVKLEEDIDLEWSIVEGLFGGE